ncbi:hypothetical protein H310_11939 [Aphanomyces invadans]|uniref:Cyclic nucleotide-binding domain-containing protein n=1 Tax=Aphanomyces invadans TaxID=157072 RepID=A0A024TJE9_9STRA|nr:hypothetical protein H310_11939 [Aphanomyces invadans]ETV94275.1 hypothetical protein H310_11939 [Aphanomyces invadans]|eukprot:XP_008877037.1 hypothetical protein H310_11939 [Aphanomyces invadans]
MGKRQKSTAAASGTHVPENKRGSLVISVKGNEKVAPGPSSKWNGLSILHVEHEATLEERKKSLIANVPILSMVVSNGVKEADVMEGLVPMKFSANEPIITKGDTDTRLYFIESGRVIISKAVRIKKYDDGATSSREEYEYFGEYPFAMHGEAQRTANVVAEGDVRCFSMELSACNALLSSVQLLLHYRFLMREHGVLDNLNVFSALNPKQRGRMLDLTMLKEYADGDYICKQGDCDDQYFVIVEGTAKICIKNNGVDVELVRKVPFQGFGEMGLFGKARTADVIAVSEVTCIVINRESFVKAQNFVLDGDAESIAATNLSNEWELMRQVETLHENPHVVAYLTRFIRRFKRSHNAKFMGKTLYTDLFRRVFHNPKLALEFPSISNKIDWFDATSAMKLIRYEAKRLMTSRDPSKADTMAVLHTEDLAFLGRLTDTSSLLDKFRVADAPNTPEQKYAMATQLAKIMEFVSFKAGKHIFKQNVVEGKAYVVLSGVVNIVLEDFGATTGTVGRSSAPPNIIASLSAGDSFGEMSLVTNMARSASAIAGTDAELILIERRNFARFFASRPGFKIRHYIIDRADFLARISFFAKYDHKSCIRLAYDMNEVKFNGRHIFVSEGQHASAFVIIKEGQVGVYKSISTIVNPTQPEKTDSGANVGTESTNNSCMLVAYLGPGECIGLSTLQPAAVESATFVAMTPIVALELADSKVRRLETSVQDLIRKALGSRGQYEARTAMDMASKGTMLLCKPAAPWCSVGDDKSRLQHHIDEREARNNSTSCTRIMSILDESKNHWHEGAENDRGNPGFLNEEEVRDGALPVHELPQPTNNRVLLLGSFLSKAMNSLHKSSGIVSVAVSPAPTSEKKLHKGYCDTLADHDKIQVKQDADKESVHKQHSHYPHSAIDRQNAVADVTSDGKHWPTQLNGACQHNHGEDFDDVLQETSNRYDVRYDNCAEDDDAVSHMWQLDRIVTDNLYL